jgi:hypothetical protein
LQYIPESAGVRDSDCTVISSDNIEFRLHRHMLATCYFFKSMFESNMMEGITKTAHLPEKSTILSVIFNFLYTRVTVSVNEAEFRDLFTATDKYFVDDLKSFAIEKIAATLTTKNAIETFLFAESFPISDLSNVVMKFISK